jgi:hypothetical protein
MRAGDVNSPVTVRARPTSAAAGAHQGRYRPIDIDRSPGMIETRRVYGLLKVHGTLTCATNGIRHQQQFLKLKRQRLQTIRVRMPQLFRKSLRSLQQPQIPVVGPDK